MEDLIRQIEEATGPDRGLDAEIALAIGWRLDQSEPRDRWWEPDRSHYLDEPPEFTASLDAALTLVPEGIAIWRIGNNDDQWEGEGPFLARCGGPRFTFAATPALALCAAALKARQP